MNSDTCSYEEFFSSIKTVLKNYQESPESFTVNRISYMFPKVVQKSYGQEKRTLSQNSKFVNRSVFGMARKLRNQRAFGPILDDVCNFKSIHFNDDQQRYIRVVIQVRINHNEVTRKDGSTLGLFPTEYAHMLTTRDISLQQAIVSLLPQTHVDKVERSEDRAADDFISYGDTIRLLSPPSKISLPDLVLLRYKRLFIKLKATIKPENNREIELPESACWSVVATGNIETTYIEPNNFSLIVTPTPKVIRIEEIKGYIKVLEIYGSGFTPDLVVFVGEYRTDKTLMSCAVPDELVERMTSEKIERLPIFMIKPNGLIYLTNTDYFL
ncbi:hypothetical protein RF11_00059 [Thelohanellus kitauei]|uniref:RBP-Jkappa IPT domain-containing protein n=1 Tax=Thelohanellus kitauei TaxID=669202 RepID=A0A0C2JX76_THEKT|nr:hypothetical protein RF11_00059 [Thelohanellus kitauei]